MTENEIKFLDTSALTTGGVNCENKYSASILNIVKNQGLYLVSDLDNIDLISHFIDCYIALRSPCSFSKFAPKSKDLDILINLIEEDIKQITLPAAVCCWFTSATARFRIEDSIPDINAVKPKTATTNFNALDYIDKPFVLESIGSLENLAPLAPASALNYSYGVLLNPKLIPDRSVFNTLFSFLLLKEYKKSWRLKYKHTEACLNYVINMCSIIRPNLNTASLFNTDKTDLI